MKLIISLMGLGALLAMTGCESDYHEHYQHRGGVYDDSYRGYGRETYPYDRDRDWEHRHWEHRDSNY
jgi:hypothetical protein